MAIQITTAPPAFASAHSQNLLTVFDSTKPQDSTTYPNYKYVCDIYVAGVLVTRLKAYPQPDTLAGVFDLGPVVRSYLASNFDPATSITGNQYQPWVRVQVKIGEEYNGTTYTNLITDSERLFFDSYKAGRFTSNAVIGDKVNDFATNRPSTVTVDESSDYALIPYFASASGSLAYDIEAEQDNGTVLINATGTVTYPSGLIHFNLSKANIEAAASGTCTGARITIGTKQTRVIYGCNPKYMAYTLAFLNQYGGYETYDFRLLSRKQLAIERQSYEQEPYRLGPSGAVSYGTSNRYYSGRSTYATRAKQRMALNTDWLSDAEYRWLAELVTSPEVFILLDGYWTPCTLRADEFVYRQGVADRLTNLTLQVEYDGDYNTQYR